MASGIWYAGHRWSRPYDAERHDNATRKSVRRHYRRVEMAKRKPKTATVHMRRKTDLPLGGPAEKKEIVKLARGLERDLARRRKLVKELTALDARIRDAKKFLRDMTEPEPANVYAPPDIGPEIPEREEPQLARGLGDEP